MLDETILEILACPVCQQKLHYEKNLHCTQCKKDFEVQDGIIKLIDD